MPELPEVEIVRQGLAPFLINAKIEKLHLRRANLRFEFPDDFAQRLEGSTIVNVLRRAKYLLIELSTGTTLLSHLGMTGNYRFFTPSEPGAFEKHDHVVLELSNTQSPSPFLVYSDPRRFCFMDLFEDPENCAFLKHLGPEPLGNQMTTQLLMDKFIKRRSPIKSVLLDQKVIAGLGNIYVCEALFRSKIHPTKSAATLVADSQGKIDVRLEVLTRAIREVLLEALEAGGSTLQDYRSVEGSSGYFQHAFAVYDREGEQCLDPQCKGKVERIVQSGRSSFFCSTCQTN